MGVNCGALAFVICNGEVHCFEPRSKTPRVIWLGEGKPVAVEVWVKELKISNESAEAETVAPDVIVGFSAALVHIA